ncbi:MAG TPA: hypothetical protein VEP92_05905 [Gaiellaceae bacterium]|nr:hypothetical protein [Gaiellaceae bacterium]
MNKQYRLINEVIHGASARYDWMTVLDWNSYSRNLNLVVRDGQHPPRWPGRGPARDLHPPRSEAAGTDRAAARADRLDEMTVARSKTGEVKFGSAAKPAFLPRISGVSSIHLASHAAYVQRRNWTWRIARDSCAGGRLPAERSPPTPKREPASPRNDVSATTSSTSTKPAASSQPELSGLATEGSSRRPAKTRSSKSRPSFGGARSDFGFGGALWAPRGA